MGFKWQRGEEEEEGGGRSTPSSQLKLNYMFLECPDLRWMKFGKKIYYRMLFIYYLFPTETKINALTIEKTKTMITLIYRYIFQVFPLHLFASSVFML